MAAAEVCLEEESEALSEALPEQIRRPDEKSSAVSLESRLKLSGVWVKSVVIEIIVVANVKRRSGVRVPTEQKLPRRI